MKEVRFTIEGDFLTEFIRDAYWQRQLGWEKTMSIGRSLIVNDQVPQEQIDLMIRQIVFYKGKMIGNSGEGMEFVEGNDSLPKTWARTIVYHFFNRVDKPEYLRGEFNQSLLTKFLEAKVE